LAVFDLLAHFRVPLRSESAFPKFDQLTLPMDTKWTPRCKGASHQLSAEASIVFGQYAKLIELLTAANFAGIFAPFISIDEEVSGLACNGQNLYNPLVRSSKDIKRNGLHVIAGFMAGMDGKKPGIRDCMAALAVSIAVWRH
jgi:hypothetical protein